MGLVLVVKGADWLVEGGSALAKKFRVSDLAIGLTIVAFGTSAPELVVNSFASYQGYEDIVFGNVIGSNNFNLYIILGITGLIIPLTVQSSTVWKEIPFSFLAIFLLLFLGNDYIGSEKHLLGRLDGIIFLLLFTGFLYYVYSQLKTDETAIEVEATELPPWKIVLFIIIGLSGLILGGHLTVDNAVEIARLLGVSEKVIGLTIVAAGTSLPELATSVVAALKKKSDIAVGNIVGSNIFNLLLILGVSTLIKPLHYHSVFNRELYILGAGTAFLFMTMFMGKKRKLERWQAAILLVSYSAYVVYLVVQDL